MAGHTPDQRRDGPAGLQAREGGYRPQGRQAGPVRRGVRRIQSHEVHRPRRRGQPRQDTRERRERAPVLFTALLHRKLPRVRDHHRESGQQVQQGAERGGARQDQGAGQGHVRGDGARRHPHRRGDPGRGMGLQEAVLHQGLQPPYRRHVRGRQAHRRHRRQGVRSGRGRVHVLHMRIRPQVQRRSGAREDGCEGHRLHVRAPGHNFLEVYKRTMQSQRN